MNPGTQLRLRAILQNTDPGITPELLDWSVESREYATSGTMTSTTRALIRAGSVFRLESNVDLPPGTDVAFTISNDGGATWLAAVSGQDVRFASEGSQLVVRATFNSPAGAASPVIDGYTVYQQSPDPVSLDHVLQIQDGPGIDDSFEISLPAVGTVALGLENADISTQQGAMKSATTLDAAVRKAAYIRGRVGAYTNALEHSKSQRELSMIQLEAGAGRIMDADMAFEMMETVRTQLLLQTVTELYSAFTSTRRQSIAALLKMPEPVPPVRSVPPEGEE